MRARERAAWPGRLVRLEDVEELELLALPPARMMAIVTELTLAAWAMRCALLPDYDRRVAPGRVVRGWEVR